jgi:hypothetical protein
MKFLKFEFADEAEWLTVKDSLYEDGALISEVAAIHEIGFIDLSAKYAVDMLLAEELEWLSPFVVWPNPCGIHIFGGWAESYTAEFCRIYPDSPYCIINKELNA